MTPTSPAAATDDAARPPPRRQYRGSVKTYGEGRICAQLACRTTLSLYNATTLCWVHAHPAAEATPR